MLSVNDYLQKKRVSQAGKILKIQSSRPGLQMSDCLLRMVVYTGLLIIFDYDY